MPFSSRRNFLLDSGAALAALPILSCGSFELNAAAQNPSDVETLAPWRPGFLDIHHISTGRGSCAFLLCPDATTLLIDAGAMLEHVQPARDKFLIDAKPNSSLRPGQWIARYVQRCLEQAGRKVIDTFLLTHFHADHMGEIAPNDHTVSPLSTRGNYQLSGLTDVAEVVPITRIVDRGFPDYSYPVPLDGVQDRNYQAFVHNFIARGGKVERFLPGSASQLTLARNPEQYPNFSIRNLAANGEVWTGIKEETRQQFPAIANLASADYPTENKCSLAIRLSYGKFDYYSSGDMDHDLRYDQLPWGDIESVVARVAGPVEVAVASHHGWVDACGPEWVKALRAKVYLINAWDSAHPTMPALNNMLSSELYPGNRDVFATAIKPESKIAVRRLAEMKSQDGHVVIRIEPGGESYQIFVLSNKDESGRILSKHGPYICS